MADELARRNFLKGAGAASTAVAGALVTVAAPGVAMAQVQPQSLPQAAPAQAAAPHAQPMLVLNDTEAAFVSAMVDVFIPADDITPSGTACGLVVYIDGQLASAWGGGARMYRDGPFHKGTPQQGYQLALTPRDFVQSGIAAANRWSVAAHGKTFDRLEPADRQAALAQWEQGKAQFDNFESRAFLETMLDLTMEGFFADPMYGGNRDMVGWKLLGFPGLPSVYGDKVAAYQGKRFIAEPKSIADLS